MSWVNTVLAAAQRQGQSPARVLAAAGIPERDLALQRWPIDHITRLWHAAATLTADPGFGLQAGSHIGPASFNVVGYILQSAPTLREAFAGVQQFQRLISDGGRFQMIAGPTASWVVYHPRQGALAFSPHQLEAVLAAVVAFARWVTHRPVTPWCVQFNQPALGPLAGYQAVFHCPVEFEQAFSGLLLDNAVLDQPLPLADAQLQAVHRAHAARHLSALAEVDTPTVAQLVVDWLGKQLGHQQGHQLGQPLAGSVPSRAVAAQALGLTERTLARRLQAEGESYTTLLDQARRQRALHAVAHSERSVADIAQSLGFAEASVFHRAFRRWTGGTPGAWRAAQVAGQLDGGVGVAEGAGGGADGQDM